MTATTRRAATALAVLAGLVVGLAACTPQQPASHPAGQERSSAASAPAIPHTKPYVTWSIAYGCGGPRGTFSVYLDVPAKHDATDVQITFGGGLSRAPGRPTTDDMMIWSWTPGIALAPIPVPASGGWVSIAGREVVQPLAHGPIGPGPVAGCPTPHTTQIQPAPRRLAVATHKPAVSHQLPALPASVARPVAAAPALPTASPTPSAMARCQAAIAARPGWVGRAIADGGSVTCVPSLSPEGSDLPAPTRVWGMTTGADVRVSAQTPGDRFASVASYEAAHAVATVELADVNVINWWDAQVGATAWWQPNDPDWPALGAERWAWTVATCQGFMPPVDHLPAAPCSLINTALAYAHGTPPVGVAYKDYLREVRTLMAPPADMAQWCQATATYVVACRGQAVGTPVAGWPTPDPRLVAAGMVPRDPNLTRKAG